MTQPDAPSTSQIDDLENRHYRDLALLTAMREAMISAVTLDEPAVPDAGPAGAARALRALLPEQTTLSGAEQHLLGEWLDRLTADRREDR